MGGIGDWFYNSVYEPLSDWGSGIVGREETTHKYRLAVADAEAQARRDEAAARAAAEAPKIAAAKAAAEAKRKAAIRKKRVAEGGRTSTIHSVSPSPLARMNYEETLGGTY